MSLVRERGVLFGWLGVIGESVVGVVAESGYPLRFRVSRLLGARRYREGYAARRLAAGVQIGGEATTLPRMSRNRYFDGDGVEIPASLRRSVAP